MTAFIAALGGSAIATDLIVRLGSWLLPKASDWWKRPKQMEANDFNDRLQSLERIVKGSDEH